MEIAESFRETSYVSIDFGTQHRRAFKIATSVPPFPVRWQHLNLG